MTGCPLAPTGFPQTGPRRNTMMIGWILLLTHANSALQSRSACPRDRFRHIPKCLQEGIRDIVADSWLTEIQGQNAIPGPAENHVAAIMPATRRNSAATLSPVLSHRVATAADSLTLAKKFSIWSRHLHVSRSLSRNAAWTCSCRPPAKPCWRGLTASGQDRRCGH